MTFKRQAAFIPTLALAIAIQCCTPKQSHLSFGDFTTDTVKRGNIETLESTEGIVQPANEVLLLSPSSSIIRDIIKKTGQRVEEGEVILHLNTAEVEKNIESITDQLEIKENTLEKTRLNSRSTRADLAYSVEVKNLQIASIKSVLADQEQLLEVGGISMAKYEKTKQELILAEKELQLAREKNAIRLEQLKAEEKGLLLQIEMQKKELTTQKDLLSKMDVKAPSEGIILNIHGKEGEKIQSDRLLVTMSDLTRFEIRGSIDDKFKDLIKTGRKVYITSDNQNLEGRIGLVQPTLENGKVIFTVALDDNQQTGLVPNQKVSLHIVSRLKQNVLRIKNGPAFGRQDQQFAFIIQGDSAYRKKILLGLVTDDYIEVLEGAGEENVIITSGVAGIKHLDAVKIEMPK